MSLNGSRKVQGTLRGYDVYLNVVLDEAVEEKKDGGKERLGMVVIRGNSVVLIEVRARKPLSINQITNCSLGARPYQHRRPPRWRRQALDDGCHGGVTMIV